MSANQIPDTPLNVSQVFPPKGGILSGEERKLLQRTGIQVFVVQPANIGFFKFPNLLIQIVSSLVLIFVARLLTDFFAFRMFRERALYRQYRDIPTRHAKELNLGLHEVRQLKHEDFVNGTLSRLDQLVRGANARPKEEFPGKCASTFDGIFDLCQRADDCCRGLRHRGEDPESLRDDGLNSYYEVANDATDSSLGGLQRGKSVPLDLGPPAYDESEYS